MIGALTRRAIVLLLALAAMTGARVGAQPPADPGPVRLILRARLPASGAAPRLFGRTQRTFSHGCIRIEKPFELAVWLLRDDPRWTPEAIRAASTPGESAT